MEGKSNWALPIADCRFRFDTLPIGNLKLAMTHLKTSTSAIDRIPTVGNIVSSHGYS